MSVNNKISVVIASCHPTSKGGISTWVRLLQKRLSYDDRVSADFLYPAYCGSREVAAVRRTFFHRIVLNLFAMFKCLKEFKNLIRARKPNVLHITTSGSLALLRDILFLRVSKRNGLRTIYHIRFGRIPSCYHSKNYEWLLFRYAIKYVDCVIAIDHSTERLLKSNFPNKKIMYIPNFIDDSIVVEKKQDQPVCSSVVFIGWCVRTKGVEELLLAWEKIVKKHPNHSLLIVGPCSEMYKNKLLEDFSMQNVVLLGEKGHRETLEILRSAEVFVLPSYTEGFPNVILEAMLMSRPIVASNVGAIPDMLEGCGLVVKSRDVESLYNALDRLLSDSDLRQELGLLAKAKLDSNYRTEIVYEQYFSVWTMNS